SEPARHAFALAGSLARSQGARLLVLHVIDQPNEPLEGLRRQLELNRLEGPGVAIEHRLVPGNPAEETPKAGRETGCGLIVMGTQGRTGVARLLLGSVAEQVVRNAPCPVVTLKEPPGASAPAAAPVRTILHPTDFSAPCEEAFRVACALARDKS